MRTCGLALVGSASRVSSDGHLMVGVCPRNARICLEGRTYPVRFARPVIDMRWEKRGEDNT
eukprot:scaffold128_cov328-Pavlova_lutheri.AAC.40